MSGTMDYNSMVRLCEEEEAIKREYDKLKLEPIEAIQRYKTEMDYELNNRSRIKKIFSFYTPVRLIALKRILDEQEPEEKPPHLEEKITIPK